MMSDSPLKLAILTVSMMLLGCVQDAGTDNVSVVAKIGDKKVTLKQLREEVSYANSNSNTVSPLHYQAVLNRIINNEIMIREGMMRNLNLRKEYVSGLKRIEARAEQEKYNLMHSLLLKQIGENISLTKVELHEYYQRSKNRFLTSSLHLRRIIVDNKKQILGVEKKIKAGSGFSKVAAQVNIDENLKKKHGDLGVLLLSEVPRELRAAAFALNRNGQVGTPFMANNKWNLLQLVRKETGIERPFADIKPKLEAELRRNKAALELKKILNDHKNRLNVEIYKTELAKYAHLRPGK